MSESSKNANIPTDVPEGYEPFFNDTGFNAYIGAVYAKPAPSDDAPARFIFDIQDIHMNGGGHVHGGLLMALTDIMLGARCHQAIDGKRCSTVSLNCDFVAGGLPDDRIEGEATITRATRSVIFVSGKLSARGKTLMSASGVWKILGA